MNKGVLVTAYCGGLDPAGQSEGVRRSEPRAAAPGLPASWSRRCIRANSRLLGKGVTVAWGLTPWSEGVGALWPGRPDPAAPAAPEYAELFKPEGPIVFAGEHLATSQTWQEGAVLSAHEALKLVRSMSAERALAAAAA